MPNAHRTPSNTAAASMVDHVSDAVACSEPLLPCKDDAHTKAADATSLHHKGQALAVSDTASKQTAWACAHNMLDHKALPVRLITRGGANAHCHIRSYCGNCF